MFVKLFVQFELVADLGKIKLVLVVKRPSIHTIVVLAGDDVEMQMEHTLLSGLARCVQDVYTAKTTVIYVVVGNLLYCLDNVRKYFRIAIHHVCAVLFGDDKCVAVAIASDIQKGVGVFVLVDFVGWNLTVDNFTKDAVFHDDTSLKLDLKCIDFARRKVVFCGHFVCDLA